MNVFEYDEDLSTGSSIRLFRLESKANEPIRGSLETRHSGEWGIYDCLSYTWGDPLYRELSGLDDQSGDYALGKHHITFNNGTLAITTNLKDALEQFAHDKDDKTSIDEASGVGSSQLVIWIDAICINQGSDKERSYQVDMMHDIYAGAQRVIIWLGVEDDHSVPAMDVIFKLNKIHKDRQKKLNWDEYLLDLEPYEHLGISTISSQEWLSYAAFLQRRFFGRVWIIQETFTAKAIDVRCGPHTLIWEQITESSSIMTSIGVADVLNAFAFNIVDGRAGTTRYVSDVLNNIWILANMKDRKNTLDMEKVCGYARYFKATNHRDHVFGVLGLLKESPLSSINSKRLKADYGKSIAMVFTEASWIILVETGDLNLLSFIQDRSLEASSAARTPKLPSWVPDWGVPFLTHPVAETRRLEPNHNRWFASRGLVYDRPIATNSPLLPLEGYAVDGIVEIAPSTFELDEKFELRGLLTVLSHTRLQYPHGSSSFEAFFRTLIKDTFLGRPADDAARAAFHFLVVRWISEMNVAIYLRSETAEASENPEEADDTSLNSLKHVKTARCDAEKLIHELSKQDISGIIPSWQEIHSTINKLGEAEPLKKRELDIMADAIIKSFEHAYGSRRLFRTRDGYLGIAAQSLEVGDSVWIIAGARVPMVLRFVSENRWELVGEAYVHGLMDGEAARMELKLEKICLQ